jgi:hypothetical protein
MSDVPAQAVKKYSLKEVEKHKDKNSTWLVIHDNVYDVTKFLEEVSLRNLILVYLTDEDIVLIYVVCCEATRRNTIIY